MDRAGDVLAAGYAFVATVLHEARPGVAWCKEPASPRLMGAACLRAGTPVFAGSCRRSCSVRASAAASARSAPAYPGAAGSWFAVPPASTRIQPLLARPRISNALHGGPGLTRQTRPSDRRAPSSPPGRWPRRDMFPPSRTAIPPNHPLLGERLLARDQLADGLARHSSS